MNFPPATYLTIHNDQTSLVIPPYINKAAQSACLQIKKNIKDSHYSSLDITII